MAYELREVDASRYLLERRVTGYALMCFIGLYGNTIDEDLGERRTLFAGGLAGAALPAGFKGAGPFGGVWGVTPTSTAHIN